MFGDIESNEMRDMSQSNLQQAGQSQDDPEHQAVHEATVLIEPEKKPESKSDTKTDQCRDPVKDFCDLYGELIRDQSKDFWKITQHLNDFKIQSEETFWIEHGDKIFDGVSQDFIDNNFITLCDTGQDKQCQNFTVRKLFSLLMHDWFNPEPDQTYALPTKVSQFDRHSSQDLFEVLLEISDNSNLVIYQNVVLRIFHQYLYELDKYNNLKDSNCYAYVETMMKYVFDVIDYETKISLMKIGTVFWLLCCEDKGIVEGIQNKIEKNLNADIEELQASNDIATKEMKRAFEELKEFCKLCFLLTDGESSFTKFQDTFECFLKSFKQCYGDYSTIEMNRDVQLLLFMATREQLYAVKDFIFQKCPDIGVNSSIISHFENVRDFASFQEETFATEELQNIVSSQ